MEIEYFLCGLMKVMFIKPPSILPENWKGIYSITLPLGICYLGSMIKSDHEVVALDALIEGWKKVNEFTTPKGRKAKILGLSFDEIEYRIEKESPDIVGITSLSVDAQSAYRVAEIAKIVNPNTNVVMGGSHATCAPNLVLGNPSIDYVVMGEGEYTIVEFLKALEDKKDMSKVKGIAWKKGNSIVINERRPLIAELDKLPFPDRSIFPVEEYFKVSKYMQGTWQTPKRALSIITSRGCPHNCQFCSVYNVTGKIWRPRSPENVVDEIEMLCDKYNVKRIVFEDDNLTLNRERFFKICSLIKERKLDFDWNTPNGIRADSLDEELIKKMIDAGCYELTLSVESGSQRVLDDVIQKRLNLEKAIEGVKLCKKLGVKKVSCYFVYGNMEETKEEIQKTVNLVRKFRDMEVFCYCFIALPYYNSRLYNMSKEKGYLLAEDGEDLEIGVLNGKALIKTPEFTPEDIYSFQKQLGREEIKASVQIATHNLPNFLRLLALHPKEVIKYGLSLVVK